MEGDEMSVRRYAEDTKVPVEQSRAEIERTLQRYGATAFAFFSEAGKAIIVFQAKDRRVRFDLPLLHKAGPENNAETRTREQDTRRKWRALLLCIKAKLESVASGIETFEEAFLAHIVLPDGETVGGHTIPRIAAAYRGEPLQPLLPPPRKP